MHRADILLILCGAVATVVLILIFGFSRALILRYRRKRQAAQAWRAPRPQAETVIADFRREADQAHLRTIGRRATDTQRRIEPQWLHDGEIVLRPKKPPEEIP